MKSIFYYSFCMACLTFIQAAGQTPSSKDIDATLANMRKLIDSVAKTRVPQNAKANGTTAMGPRSMGAIASKPDTAYHYTPPARNDKMLGSLPQKTLSTDELKTFVSNIDKKYTEVLRTEGIQLPPVEQMDAGAICQAAILDLVQEGGELCAWMAIKAIEKAPGNILVLNNCGAILNGCGFQPVAIPVLETALQRSPENSTVQNNLGQAYIALGDVQKATQYLQQCIRTSPEHPHANFSLACINYAKGDNASALKYTENSLRGSFSDKAWHLLFKLKKDARLIDYLKDRYKQPGYFDEDKYHLPLQCEQVGDIPVKRAEFKVYHQNVESAKRQLNQLADQEFALGKQSIQQNIHNYRQSNIANAPFAELGAAMLLDINQRMTDQGGPEIGKKQQEYKKKIELLTEEYNNKARSLDNCASETGLANDYMEKMAFVTTEYQRAYLRVYNDYYTDNIFWGSFATTDEHLKKGFFYRYAASLLSVYLQLGETNFLDPSGCGAVPEIKLDTEALELPKPDCPIDIDWKCIVGSFHLDCEKIKFSTKAGLLLNVDHSFKNHRTTIMIGAGIDLNFGKRSAGAISGEFGATGKMQYFISFDGTKPCDQGLIWKTSVSYKEEITNDYGFKNITTTNMDYGAGTTLSVANGWTFEGQLY
ncbi:MAG: tetratricopeptide repeat protein, partial [Chitinophagales bacterium]